MLRYVSIGEKTRHTWRKQHVTTIANTWQEVQFYILYYTLYMDPLYFIIVLVLIPHLLVDLYYSVGRAIQNQLFNENKIMFYRCDGTLYLDWNKLAMILFLPR